MALCKLEYLAKWHFLLFLWYILIFWSQKCWFIELTLPLSSDTVCPQPKTQNSGLWIPMPCLSLCLQVNEEIDVESASRQSTAAQGSSRFLHTRSDSLTGITWTWRNGFCHRQISLLLLYHSSEKRGLRSMKCSSETLQKGNRTFAFWLF